MAAASRSASVGSDSSARERKKKKKKKKEKEKERTAVKREREVSSEAGERDKAKKSKQNKQKKKHGDERSRSGSAHRPAAESACAPDLRPSGLLGGGPAGDADMSPPRRAPVADRSRSRDSGERGGPTASAGKGGGKDAGKGGGKGEGEQVEKVQPNFEASGLLGLEDNSKNGVALKFTVPPEARMPTQKWRLYIFTKQSEEPKIIHIHRQKGILFGKDRRVADVPTDHQTCSKQHAVLHFRQAGDGQVKPYILDLDSVNGTFLNGKRIEGARYYELRERDALKFGMSTREFVLLHGGSANHMKIDPSRLRSPSP